MPVVKINISLNVKISVSPFSNNNTGIWNTIESRIGIGVKLIAEHLGGGSAAVIDVHNILLRSAGVKPKGILRTTIGNR